jgi:hypothetical protein
VSWFSSVPPGKFWNNTLQLGHDGFLPHRFQFIGHFSPFHSTLYTIFCVTEKVSLNKPQINSIQKSILSGTSVVSNSEVRVSAILMTIEIKKHNAEVSYITTKSATNFVSTDSIIPKLKKGDSLSHTHTHTHARTHTHTHTRTRTHAHTHTHRKVLTLVR